MGWAKMGLVLAQRKEVVILLAVLAGAPAAAQVRATVEKCMMHTMEVVLIICSCTA
jgi:hypothetical protein